MQRYLKKTESMYMLTCYSLNCSYEKWAITWFSRTMQTLTSKILQLYYLIEWETDTAKRRIIFLFCSWGHPKALLNITKFLLDDHIFQMKIHSSGLLPTDMTLENNDMQFTVNGVCSSVISFSKHGKLPWKFRRVQPMA